MRHFRVPCLRSAGFTYSVVAALHKRGPLCCQVKGVESVASQWSWSSMLLRIYGCLPKPKPPWSIHHSFSLDNLHPLRGSCPNCQHNVGRHAHHKVWWDHEACFLTHVIRSDLGCPAIASPGAQSASPRAGAAVSLHGGTTSAPRMPAPPQAAAPAHARSSN